MATNAISYEQRVSNCEKVIDGLSHDVLNVDLSHITAENIVDGDINTIQNLLEIFKELLDFILDVDDEFDLEHATSFDGKEWLGKMAVLSNNWCISNFLPVILSLQMYRMTQICSAQITKSFLTSWKRN